MPRIAARFRGVATALAATVMVAGCASFRGEPRSIVAPDGYGEVEALEAYRRLTTDDARLAYRNQVAYLWLSRSEADFTAFRHDLSREMKSVNAGTSLAVLVLNGAAAVSGAEAARALAIGSSTLVGANATLNREAFLDQSIATALTTAQANRTRRATDIRRRLLQDSPSQYPLGDALYEIQGLNAFASINNASAQMAATAVAQLNGAEEEAAGVVRVSIAPPDVHAVRAQFSAYVVTVTDTAVLDRLAVVLAAAKDPALPIYQRNIGDAYATRAEGGAAAINALAPALKEITGRDFKL